MDLFDFGYSDALERGEETKRIRVLSLFSGIGAFEKALDRVGIDYELVNFCEIDRHASKAYCAIHGVSEDLNLWDVCKVDPSKLHDIDLLTYGFPCQDISIAGRQKGMLDEWGNLTRSGLFFEALRIIKGCRPRIAIAENVKNLMSESFREQYHIVQESLGEAGYTNYVEVLNAKNYGVPQNRERVFIVSIRKDIDMGFEFPEPVPLEKCLADLLEDEVAEKYYLSDDVIKSFEEHKARNEANGNGFGWNVIDIDRQTDRQTDRQSRPQISGALQTASEKRTCTFIRDGGEWDDKHRKSEAERNLHKGEGRVRPLYNIAGKKTQSRTVYGKEGVSPTLCAGMDHGNTMPFIEEGRKEGRSLPMRSQRIRNRQLQQPSSERERETIAHAVTTGPAKNAATFIRETRGDCV